MRQSAASGGGLSTSAATRRQGWAGGSGHGARRRGSGRSRISGASLRTRSGASWRGSPSSSSQEPSHRGASSLALPLACPGRRRWLPSCKAATGGAPQRAHVGLPLWRQGQFCNPSLGWLGLPHLRRASLHPGRRGGSPVAAIPGITAARESLAGEGHSPNGGDDRPQAASGGSASITAAGATGS